MQQQSKMLPRFWIDDVYVTGILLYGLEQVEWYDFSNTIKWSYYDFWDLMTSYSIYDIYIGFKKLFINFKIADYYNSNHFIILHVKTNQTEIDYDQFNDKALNNILLNSFNDKSGTQNVSKDNFICIQYDNNEKNLTLTNDFLNCFNSNKNFYNYYFNHFCHELSAK